MPKDVCGVAGGNGTSCLDDCGVANGDGSSCADDDGLTDDGDDSFGLCVDDGTTRAERQSVRLRAAASAVTGMFGTYRLSFGGETTAVLSVFSTADEILAALEAIPSIGEGSVTVTGLLNDQMYNKTSGGGISEVHYGISFRDALVGNVGSAPQNFGPLPMVVELVALDGITGDGLADSSTERRCGGQYASGYDYAEQLVTVTPLALGGNLTELAAAGARFTLALNGSTGTTDAEDCATHSDALTPGGADAAPAALTSALLAIGGGLTDKDIEIFPNVTSASELSFIVRFLTRAKTDLTGCTTLGAMPTLLAVNASANLAVAVRVLTVGLVPKDQMPIDTAAIARAAGEAAVAAEEAAEEAGTPATVIEVIKVCGDAIYVTAEACDDGNRVAGDGCGTNCTIEAGYQCTNRIGRASSCFIPTDPVIGFSATIFGPFDEGSFANVTVTRLGDNQTAASVDYFTVDSSANRAASENDMYAPGAQSGGDAHAVVGDYRAVNGTLSFAAGEVSKTISIEVLRDFAYDGAIDEHFAIRLSSAVGADLNDNFATAYVAIRDYDVAPSASPSVPPTPSPSGTPSFAPTSFPSYVPTPYPSQPPSPMPSPAPTTAAPTVSFNPTGGKPSSVPTSMPSAMPTPVPSPDCGEGLWIYRLKLFDSGGDGWQGATYTLRNSTDGTTIAETDDIVTTGTLSGNDSFESNVWLCLSDGCYEMTVGGGSADSEISYEFLDEAGDHFMGSSAITDHLCVTSGDVFAHPSAAPSVSQIPTLSPTPLPTVQLSVSYVVPPSSVPTPEPVISVSASISLSGMECADYGTVEESALVSGVAASLDGIDTDHIGDTECSDDSRRRHRELRGSGDSARRLDASTSVSIAFAISIPVSDVTDDTVTDGAGLASSISDSLTTAIASGNLTSSIASAAAAANSTAFADASVTGHTVTTHAPTPAPTATVTVVPTLAPTTVSVGDDTSINVTISDPTDSLNTSNDDAPIGLIVGVIFGVITFAVLVFVAVKMSQRKHSPERVYAA